MKLFEYVILYHERLSKKQEEDGKTPTSKILVDVTRVLAKDEREVLINASRQISEEYLDKLDRVEIAVRPF